MKEVKGVILVSPNGRDAWSPVPQEQVPEWVREPDNMKRLVEGYVCFKERMVLAPGVEETAEHYRLQVLEETADVIAIREAADKRERKNAARLR